MNLEVEHHFFTNREIALIVWLVIVVVVLLILRRKDFIEFGGKFLKPAFSKVLVKYYLLTAAYTILVLYLLSKIHFWEMEMIKHTVYWYVGIGIGSIFKLSNVKVTRELKPILTETLKWTVILEFAVNINAFSVSSEMVIIPGALLCSIILVVGKSKNETNELYRKFTNVVSIVGLILFSYIIYYSIKHHDEVFTLHKLKEILLPIILTTTFLPFAYLFVVFLYYDQMFRMLNHYKAPNVELVKKKVMIHCNISLDRLSHIRKGMIFRLADKDKETINRYFRKRKA